MRKFHFTLLFSFVGFMTYAQSLTVQIKQDGKIVEPINDVYLLAKSPFQFEISATDIEGFLVGATTKKVLYTTVIASTDISESWFQNTGMTEELFNKDKELYLMDLAPSYWYFTDSKDHRFDKNPKGSLEHWSAKRTITRFYDVLEDETILLNDFEGSAYILMYSPIYNQEYDMEDRENLFQAELRFID